MIESYACFGVEQRVGHEWQRLKLRTQLTSPDQALEVARSYNDPERYRAVRYITTTVTEVLTQREECKHCFCLESMPPKCCKCGEPYPT